MPITATDIKEYNAPKAIIWQMSNMHYGYPRMICSQEAGESFLHSFPNYLAGFSKTGGFAECLNSDKQFIFLENLFTYQFHKKEEFYQGLQYHVVKQKVDESLSYLLKFNPDVISLELTHEQSIFYTLKKGGYTIFLQHFFYVLDDDDDEAILTVFKNGSKLPSFAGSLEQTITVLEDIFQLKSFLSESFDLYELS